MANCTVRRAPLRRMAIRIPKHHPNFKLTVWLEPIPAEKSSLTDQASWTGIGRSTEPEIQDKRAYPLEIQAWHGACKSVTTNQPILMESEILWP